MQQRVDSGGESDVIIEFHDDRDALTIISGFGKAGRKLGILKARVATVSNWRLAQLASHPGVKRVSLDRSVQSLNGRTAITIGARTVNEVMGYTGAGIGVAVIDSGVSPWHDDLTVHYQSQYSDYYDNQRVAHFKDFINGYSTSAYDDWGHGTHVAGIVAGNGKASLGGQKSVAPGASIVALKALDANGRGTISTIIAAIEYAISVKPQYNIRVINLSLGAGVYESYHTDPLTLAAKRATEAGIVVVAAAGNLGQALDGMPQYGGITAPANAPWVLSVGASSTQGTIYREDDIMAPYSSRGPTMYDHSAKPDLVAPGTGSVSLSAKGSTLYDGNPTLRLAGAKRSSYLPYLSLSGTSMAAPVVSGTVALMLQANPGLTPNLVKAMLQFTAQKYPSYNWLSQGAGFLNAHGAVQLAKYFASATRGSPYPSMTGWSRHLSWGNHRVSGGVLTPGGSAWGLDVAHGDPATPLGQPIVWGENCIDACDNIVWGNNAVWGLDGDDNIVWGNTDDDNIVWGNSNAGNIVWGNGEDDNIVWGNSGADNIVWGNDCGGADCDNIVWGNTVDNIVWGNCEGDGCDNIVWGNTVDTVVWGQCEGDGCDNIVWGNDEADDIVWGNVAPVVFDSTAVVIPFDATVWESLFQFSVIALGGGQ